MSRWWLVIALLLSVGLNVGILAAIGARRAAMPGPQESQPQNQADAAKPANNDPVPRLARLADRLKLEGDTRRKFLDIQWNLYQETTRLRLDLGEVHRALRKELTRPDPDRQKVEALLTESSRLYLALERSLVNNVFATRELLGPEKEAEYLKVVGRLRVPNPGPGIMNPSAEPQQKPGMLERMRQRRMRQQRRQGQGADGPP
jgi:Spy/CpxP family protein refolding chaperone